MRLRHLAIAAASCVVMALASGEAAAYPQFQLSTGNARCSLCHISPAGGGLINDYGRGESADTISQFGGNGAFLYGAYQEPEWLKLGVDLRAMTLGKTYDNGEADVYAFPMQGDTYASFQVADLTLYTAFGPRAQVRAGPVSLLERIGAREYWLMWRPNTVGWYARAGRFMAPFGLRSQDHTLYTRRYQGFHAWEETYSASAGKVEADWEAHVTAFTAVPAALQGYGPGESGGVAYWEKRLDEDETTVVGAQTRIGIGDGSQRYTLGGVGKYWLEGGKLLFMGELDLTLQDFAAGGSPSRGQLASYLGATWLPRTGFMVTTAFERFDPDLAVKNTWHDAYSVALQYFPLAHWEIMLEAKVELPGNYGRAQSLGFLQLHYYL